MLARIRSLLTSLDVALDGAIFQCNEWRRENVYPLIGNPAQIVMQVALLDEMGIEVRRCGMQRYVTTLRDYKIGMRYFYRHAVSGWATYGDDMIKFGICTREEYHWALEACMTLTPAANIP